MATGDGEEIMRGCLAFLAVEEMRRGKNPQEACREAIRRLRDYSLIASSAPVVSSEDSQAESSDENSDSEGGRLGKQENQAMHDSLTVAVLAMNPSGEVSEILLCADAHPLSHAHAHTLHFTPFR